MSSPSKSKFSELDLTVLLLLLAILGTLAWATLQPMSSHCGNSDSGTVNNGRQLFLAGFQMATDGEVQGDIFLGWPGDLATRVAKGRISTVADYVERLVAYDYLKPTDVIHIFRAEGITPWKGPPAFLDGEANCPFKIYRVTNADGASVIFCATKNFTYNQPLDPKQNPYGSKGFVLIRKGGDGTAYKGSQTGALRTLGLLPGRKDFEDNPHEQQTDSLLQR